MTGWPQRLKNKLFFLQMMQTASDDSVMVLTAARMYDATANSVALDLNITVYNAGSFDATVIPEQKADVFTE